MEWFDALLKRFNIKLSDGAKTALIIVVGLILALVALSFLKSYWDRGYHGGIGMGGGTPLAGVTMPSMPPLWQDASSSYIKLDGEYAMEEAAMYGMRADTITLSARNAASIYPPQPGYSTGATAEEYEVSDYYASIETNDLSGTCMAISSLKARVEIIFESSNESDNHCFYSFKVEHAAVEQVLSVLKSLNPKDLSENTYTLKEQLDDFTSETEILEAKLEAIEETLADALRAYDEVAELAASTQNAESLARVVSSKVQTIERLTQERITITQQLQYLARAKTQQADKLNYSYFSVSIYENKYLDGEGLADSWKRAVQQFFYSTNAALQGITITLISLVLWAVQYLLYFLLLVVLVKFGWKLAKYIWDT